MASSSNSKPKAPKNAAAYTAHKKKTALAAHDRQEVAPLGV